MHRTQTLAKECYIQKSIMANDQFYFYYFILISEENVQLKKNAISLCSIFFSMISYSTVEMVA